MSRRPGWRLLGRSILALLAGRSATVAELAGELEVSETAVRRSVGRLRRSGLVWRTAPPWRGLGAEGYRYHLMPPEAALCTCCGRAAVLEACMGCVHAAETKHSEGITWLRDEVARLTEELRLERQGKGYVRANLHLGSTVRPGQY